MTMNQKSRQLSELKRILIVGNGGRENSIAWALSQNKSIEQIYVCPGNGGTSNFEKCSCLPAKYKDEKTIILECKRLKINLIIIGPEMPLAEGLAGEMRNEGLTVFGPCKEGAQLEASKDWAKTLMIENNIPTAKYWATNSKEEALEILDRFQRPLVIKADGLAAGKGVAVCETIDQTKDAIRDVFSLGTIILVFPVEKIDPNIVDKDKRGKLSFKIAAIAPNGSLTAKVKPLIGGL